MTAVPNAAGTPPTPPPAPAPANPPPPPAAANPPPPPPATPTPPKVPIVETISDLCRAYFSKNPADRTVTIQGSTGTILRISHASNGNSQEGDTELTHDVTMNLINAAGRPAGTSTRTITFKS